MRKEILLLALSLFTFTFLSAQDPVPSRGKVFDDNVVPRVDIFIDPVDLNTLLDPGNVEEFPATFIFTNGVVPDTVNNIGFRLRGNTSLTAAKKSFKVSFNTFVNGQKYKGLEKMNINGEHNDPSVTRAKVAWDLLRDLKLPGARANHVELYINNDYYGLYANIEHIDEEFVDARFGNNYGNLYKCLYPADLEYLGPDPDAYKLETQGRRVYDLKTNNDIDDYSDLAEFIDILNNASDQDFACEIEQVFNIDDYLKYLAFDILTGNWDGPIYNKNNFYLYHNPTTDLIEYIPYDLDNSLGIDWLNQDWGNYDIYDWTPEPRPLYDRIMDNQTFRDQFSFYIQEIVEEEFNLGKLEDNLNFIRTLIGPFVETDPYYPLDYGFSFQEFEDSFEEELPYFQTDYGIKPYIETRGNSVEDQVEDFSLAPIVSFVNSNMPNANQDIQIRAKVIDDGAIDEVRLCYSVDGGAIECVDMLDNGNSGDLDSGDDVYGAVISALGLAAEFTYQVIATDDNGIDGFRPYCGEYELSIAEPIAELYINELMPSNDQTIADDFGEYDDWIELYHAGPELLFIGGFYLSDDPANPDKWSLPGAFMEPGEFLILWLDNDNGLQGEYHANFKLSSAGETVGLYDANLNLIDVVTFPDLNGDDAYGRIPNGTGPFEEVMPTPGESNVALSSVFEQFDTDKLEVYPNPTAGRITLDLKEWHGKSSLLLIDVTGRQIWERHQLDLAPGLFEIQLDAHPGFYQLVMLDEQGKIFVTNLEVF